VLCKICARAFFHLFLLRRISHQNCTLLVGKVDRAKTAFARALDLDPENVNAMVGAVILDMASLDDTSREYRTKMENAIKMMSVANLLDHSNAMVQNHLANHYFWKWTPVSGTVQLTEGSKEVKGSQPIPLDQGEKIRIGTDFETHVSSEDADEGDSNAFQVRDAWRGPSSGTYCIGRTFCI
jgi:RNA polymerase-associated protein CTR9